MYQILIGSDIPDKERLRKNVEFMMERGIKLKDISEIRSVFNNTRGALFENMQFKYGIDNPNSTKQIGEYLELASREIPYGQKNDYIDACYQDGKWVTDKYSLNKLSALGYEFADDLLAYREAKKNAETINSLAEHLDANNMLHPSVSLAKTNRVNYSSPALGQMKKELIEYIIEPLGEDEKMYSIDIKNQEPAILINALKDPELMSALTSGDGLYETMFKWAFKPFTTMSLLADTLEDDRVYKQSELISNLMVPADTYTPMRVPCSAWFSNDKRVVRVQRIVQGVSDGCEIQYPNTVTVECEDGTTREVPVKWEVSDSTFKRTTKREVVGWIEDIDIEISKQERKEFKTCFLAMTYGASSFGIEKQCKIIDGAFVYKKITSLNGMSLYRKKCGQAAKNGVQTMSTLFGTAVRADKYKNTNELKRSLLSIPIQGTGADILDLLVVHFMKEVERKFVEEDRPYIYFTRHDELIICAKARVVERMGEQRFKEWLTETMEHRINDSTVFNVEVNALESISMEDLLS